MKNDAISADVSRFAVDLGLYQAGGQVVAWIGPPVLGHGRRIGAEIHRRLGEFLDIVGDVGIAGTEDHVRPVKYLLLVLLGNADHVADDLQRQWSGKLGNQFPFAVGMRGDHRVDEPTCAIAHRCLGTGDHLRRERSADDVAQPLMPRVVERDHRSEELRDFGREVVDPDVGIRAVDVRMTAGEVDIVELRHHPMAGALLEPGRCRLAPERDRRLAPQRGEGPVADVVVFQPELPGAADRYRKAEPREGPRRSPASQCP